MDVCLEPDMIHSCYGRTMDGMKRGYRQESSSIRGGEVMVMQCDARRGEERKCVKMCEERFAKMTRAKIRSTRILGAKLRDCVRDSR